MALKLAPSEYLCVTINPTNVTINTMGFIEKLGELTLSRRQLMTEGTKLGASISLLSLAKDMHIPSELSTTAGEEVQKINVLKEVWQRENISELLRSLESSYEPFGISADAARNHSGTVSYFRGIEDFIAQRRASPKGRRELFSALFSGGEPTKNTNTTALRNSAMVYSQFEPLQHLDGTDEEVIAQHYASARTMLSEKLTSELVETTLSQRKSQNDRSSAGEMQADIPPYVNEESRIENTGPFVDSSIGKAGSELIRAYITALAQMCPGFEAMVPFVRGYRPRVGEGASVNSASGILNVNNTAPLDQALNPRLILHEFGHLRANEVLEKNTDLSELVLPERLHHWDPRLLLKTRTEINEIIAKLVHRVTQTEVAGEGAIADYSALHIHFSDKQWVVECSGKDEENLPQDPLELIELAQSQKSLPERGKSPTMDLLCSEIGDGDAHLAQLAVLTNLHSDPKKLVGLREILNRHPNSSVLQRWVMKIVEDIEHFIIDINLNYCEVACTNSAESISKSELNGGSANIIERLQDPRAEAAFSYAQTYEALFRPNGEEKISYEEVAMLPAQLRDVFENTVSNLLKNAGVVDEQARVSGYEALAQHMQCALILSQVIYDDKEPTNPSSLIEADPEETLLLQKSLMAITPLIASSDSSQIAVSFGQTAETNAAQSQEVVRKNFERSLINATISLLRMTYYPGSFDSVYPSFFFLKDVVQNLSPPLGTNENSSQQLNTLQSMTSNLEAMIALAERVGLTSAGSELPFSVGIETVIEMAHRTATPFLLGWDYEEHAYNLEVVSALSNGLSLFKDSKQITGVDFLPSKEVQDVLLRTLEGDFGDDITQAVEDIQATCIEVQSNQSNIGSFVERARMGITLLRSSFTKNLENDTVSQDVRVYLESLDLIEEAILTVEIVPPSSLEAAVSLLLHRMQMATLGWVSSDPIDFNTRSSGNFHNQYLGARREAVG